MNTPAITALLTVQQAKPPYITDLHFKHFGGKPMYQLMIDKLLSISSISRIVVTTDSDLVKKMYSGHSKVSTIDFPNPDTLSEEHSSERILEEMLTSDWFTAHSLEKTQGEHFLQTQCINPLLTVQTIESAIERYYSSVVNFEYDPEYAFDSVMSLTRVEKRLFESSNYPVLTLRDEPHFVIYEDTIINIFSRANFMKKGKKKFGKNPMIFEVPELEKLAVETNEGYILAKLAFDNKALFD